MSRASHISDCPISNSVQHCSVAPRLSQLNQTVQCRSIFYYFPIYLLTKAKNTSKWLSISANSILLLATITRKWGCIKERVLQFSLLIISNHLKKYNFGPPREDRNLYMIFLNLSQFAKFTSIVNSCSNVLQNEIWKCLACLKNCGTDVAMSLQNAPRARSFLTGPSLLI